MYKIKLSNNIPEPSPAKSDRIVAAHYYGAWKKGSAGLHNGFDDIHNYPERTPLLGYYDEDNPDLCDWEIKWAAEHGINCFIHCWYRYKENKGKPVTREALRCAHALHEAMFNAKFQEHMKFAIMYENAPTWGGTDREDLLNNLLPFWFENYFTRKNYLVIDNKPVLMVCHPEFLNKDFKSEQEEREVFDECREYAKKYGFDGLYIGAAIWDYKTADTAMYFNCEKWGYDFTFGYDSGYMPEQDTDDDEEIINGQCEMLKKRIVPNPMKQVPTASCFRDAEPRTTEAWNKLGYNFAAEKKYHLSPEGYRVLLSKMKAITDELPEGSWGKKMLMIDNWNEWDEGHYVSPSHEFGFKYLQAIREELTEKNNLPDYRMPQDIGLSNFNDTWGEPDLSEECKKKFGVKY